MSNSSCINIDFQNKVKDNNENLKVDIGEEPRNETDDEESV